MVRDYISRARLDRYGRGQLHFLPAGGRFARECHSGQQGAGACPEMADMGAGIGRTFIETECRDRTIGVGLEFRPHFNRHTVVYLRPVWCLRLIPDSCCMRQQGKKNKKCPKTQKEGKVFS